MDRVARRVAAVGGAVLLLWLFAGHESDRNLWITAFAQCGANPIVCENQLTGDPDFDVDAAGDPLIEGFATDISVNVGDPIGFKIKTDSTDYQVAIYRLGFYKNAGARKIATLGPFHTPQPQTDCLTDSVTGLVDCANWSVTTSWNTAGAVSGIYVAKLTRNNVTPPTPGLGSHIVFIVRHDARTADIVFQTSDTTWQAYNQWGGASLYCGGPVLNAGTDYRCTGRAVKVSYNRPFDTRSHDPQSFLFNAEYPMVRWLEANGFDVKYWAGVDTDRRGVVLTGPQKPKAFFSVGHDEYWSANQRTRVEQARNAGVNLGFFSGNEVYWKTRFEKSLDTPGTDYRTLVSYKETLRNATNNNPLDPLDSGATPISTATWRDTRFGAPADGGRPENALTGQFWTVNCCSTEIEVPATMKDLRFWRNTRIATLAAGTSASLSSESLGYEWDEDLDNGFRPAGLVRLSSTTRSVSEKILDFGSRVGPGTATHSLTLYRHNSGALVFGAGTVQWSWGLDGDHDRGDTEGTHLPDQAIQQATINLLADMDVQPADLKIGADPARPLVRGVKSTDILGPTSRINSPVSGTSLRSGARVVVSGTAQDQAGSVVAGVEISIDNGPWKPAEGGASWTFSWSPGTVGLSTIRARAIDDSGNIEAAGPAVTVNVDPGLCPCTSLWPASTIPPIADFNDTAALELGVKFKSDIDGFITGVRYYKSTANTGPHVGSLWTTTGTLLAQATFVSESSTGWQQVLFGAPVAITANTTYIASYHTNTGHYAASSGYFNSQSVDSPPLHALSSVEAGGNGVFVAAGASAFPRESFGATNYWVDVVFSPTSSDVTAPVISSIRATTIDSSSAVITWTTDEAASSRIEYSTDAELPPGATSVVTDGAFVTSHRVTLGHLTPNTTYFYRVTSSDRTGNGTTVLAPSFTVPGPTLRDTAQADFAAGQSTLTYAAQTEDGELILAPAEGSEFAGNALPAGWTAVAWTTGGSATVRNGLLQVDGARVGTCANDAGGNCTVEAATYGPGRSLEFVATFSGDGFQHAGLGVTLGSLAEPWAIFSTFTGGTLYARTNTGAVSVDQPLGSTYLAAPHRYRIDWKADGTTTFFIDGVQVAAHTAVVAGPMRPVAASDFNTGNGSALVDWVRMTPYASIGTFLSRVFDASAPVNWNSIQWVANTPAGTNLKISLRTGDTATPDASWTAFAPVATPGPLALRSRYIQYRAEMSTTNPAATPRLDDIIISTGHSPVAAPDSRGVPQNGTLVLPASGPGSLLANDVDPDPADVLSILSVTQPAHGSTVLGADGTVTYTPAVNYSGSDAFTYTITDGLLTATAVVSITVGPQNVAPVAQPDFYTMNEDATLSVQLPAGRTTGGVLLNDTDADGDTLSAILVLQPAHGTLALNANGTFTYIPERNFAGSDAFRYKATDAPKDGALESNETTVQITINQVNDAPITEPDTFTAVLNTPLTIAAPGVLRNDHDVEVEDTAPLHAALVGTPAHGTVTLAADGSFTFHPDPDFVGAASFTYSAADHFNAVGNVATVTINVQIEAVTEQSTNGGTVSTGAVVTAADPLQTAVTTPTAATVTIAQGVLSSANLPGSFTFLNRQVNVTVRNADGTEFSGGITNPLTLSFRIDASLIPAGQSAATLQVFRDGVKVQDCLGATAIPSAQADPCVTTRQTGTDGSVLIALLSSHASDWNMGLASTSAAPVAQNDAAYFTTFGTPLIIPGPGVLGNDYGRAALSAAFPANDPAPVAGGTVTLAPSGGFTFTPQPAFCGLASFKYVASTGTLVSNIGTATIRVNCGPVATADTFQVLEDSGNSTLTVLANDSDPEDGTNVKITAVTQPAHGTVAIATGAAWVTYAPQADFFGTDTFTYTISDTRGDKATATVTVTVKPVDDVPQFVKGADQTVLEDAGAKTVAGWATSISAGPANESTQALNFIVTTNNDALFSALPAVAANGTLTFTPAANANGSATVTVAVHDNGGPLDGGVDTSASQTFVITVTPVNDAPTFVKGTDQTVLEDSGPKSVAWATAISAGPADEAAQTLTFTVTNDNAGLFAAAPSVSTTGVLTFTPAANASGSSTVTVKLQDDGGTLNGGFNSSVQTFLITVKAVNDAPAFVKGADQTVLEDAGAQTVAGWATSLSAGPASEAGQTLNFSVTASNTTLFSVQPAITPAGTLSYTPAANASGSTTVTVVLRDSGGTLDGGFDASAPQTFTINITPVNDAPSFVKGLDQTVLEDAGAKVVTAWASSISAGGGADESTQLLTFNVTNSNNALFSAQPAIAANGTLTFTPAANANGSALVTVKLQDDGGIANGGVNASAAQTFTITVTAVNDAPSFTKGADQTVLEDAAAQTVVGWATAISPGPADETAQTVSFTVTNDNNALFTVQPAVAANGTLTYTPAPNASGSAIVSVIARDSGGTLNGASDASAAQTFVISLTAVNDQPAFTKGPDQTVREDALAQTVPSWATGISAGASESGQSLTFEVTNSNNALFSAQPQIAANGTLTYTPAANANGSATVTVALRDNGGTLNGGMDLSASQTFTITVTPVNDVPSFTKGANQVVLEDAGAQSIAWATAISAGAANESAQTLNFIVSNSNNALFSAQPQVSATGTLTFTASPNANGSATVTVQLHDSGGIADSGIDTSASQTFTITVTAVNDAPSFVKGADQISSAGAGAQTVAVWATNLSAGPADESAQTLNFIVTTNNASLFSVQPAIAANGTLTYTPSATGSGSATVTVQLHDNGGIANSGVDTSAAQTFTIALPFATTTTLSSPTVSPTTYGTAVVLNASVTSAGGTPTGSVDFLDNGALLGNVALTATGTASLTTSSIGAGTTRTITAVYKPTPAFTTSQAAITRAVNPAATTSTFTVTPSVVQYSDVATFETTVTPGNLGSTLPALSASFKIGTQIVGTAPFVWDPVAGVARARYSGPLVEGSPATGQLKPGAKTIAIVYNDVSPNYTVANRTSSMSITREDAAVAYVGDTSVVCTTNCAAVPVVLRAQVGDTDTSPGDLTRATVAFINRTTGLTIATVPVAADGTATVTWTANLGTATSQTTKIGMVVGNYYIRSNTLDDGTVVITKR